jgi:hypothetical protein
MQKALAGVHAREQAFQLWFGNRSMEPIAIPISPTDAANCSRIAESYRGQRRSMLVDNQPDYDVVPEGDRGGDRIERRVHEAQRICTKTGKIPKRTAIWLVVDALISA